MKTIGLVGGTSWASTVDYYKFINEETNRRLGGSHFARCIIYSLDFGEIAELSGRGNLDGVIPILIDAARKLENAGAECILLCANTMHKFYDQVSGELSVPVIHIVDATAREILDKKLSKVGLIGTKYTMEEDFYRERLAARGIEAVTPGPEDRSFLHDLIMEDLVKEIFDEEKIKRVLEIIAGLADRGCGGIILGCTEFPLIIKEGDIDIPAFNTTLIHSRAAVEFALAGD